MQLCSVVLINHVKPFFVVVSAYPASGCLHLMEAANRHNFDSKYLSFYASILQQLPICIKKQL